MTQKMSALRLLHLDASARPGRRGSQAHGSHTRALSHRFVSRWLAQRPQDRVDYRDVGATPPGPVDARWIHAAFTDTSRHEDWMPSTLAESDRLVDELLDADVLVLGVPMYNFGAPAPFKAWIDNIVRIGRTVAFDPSRPDDPYVPLLADRLRHAVLLSSRGGFDMDAGGALAHMNHLDPHVRTVLGFIGIPTLDTVAIEYEETGGPTLARSVSSAMTAVDRLVDRMQAGIAQAARQRTAAVPD